MKKLLLLSLVLIMTIWSPQPGPQVRAAVCPVDFTFFGGTRGGGKTECLIGRQVRGAEKYDFAWNGLIVRRKYKEFSKIRNRFDELIRAGLPAERIGGDQQVNTIRFNHGGKITMAAISRLEMANDFVGEEYCVAEDTPIIMGDGSTQKIQDISPGDMVMTLEGPKEVLRCMPPKINYCVEAITPFGSQVHPVHHPIFSTSGWKSYASILDEHSITIEEILQGSLLPPVVGVSSVLYKPPFRQTQQSGQKSNQSRVVYKYDSQCLERLKGLLSEHLHLLPPSEHTRRPLGHKASPFSSGDSAYVPHGFQTIAGFPAHCFCGYHPCGALSQFQSKIDPGDTPLQGDVEAQTPLGHTKDVQDNAHKYTRRNVSLYEHPYTGEVRETTEGSDVFPCAISFYGKAKVYDLTVKDVNHYITGSSFLVNKNTEISIDECTTFPFFIAMVDKLSGSNRSPHGVPCRMFGTGNPGGPGHNEVKLYFHLGQAFNVKPGTVLYNDVGESRVYIPSFLKDNKILCDADPKYVRKLMSIRDPMLRRAWLEGDWDVYIGQAFLLSPEHHIIKPIPVPDQAPLYMTFDWGYSAPFSVGWWWIDADGRIYRFSEWYGFDQEANEGFRFVDSKIGAGIIEREKKLGIWGKKITRLCDPTCMNKKPDYKGGGQGPSTANEFAKLGLRMRPGDPSRKLKIRQFRERLSIPEDPKQRPMMQIYDTCRDFISTIPSLCMDDYDPEDIDCLVAGTLISTPKGDIPIEHLSIGDMVDTPIGPREILKAGLAGNDRTIKVNLSNRKTIEGTQDHKIFINSYGLLPLCLVSSGHTLNTKENLSWFKNKFTRGSNLEDLKTEDILSVIRLMLQNLGPRYCTERFGLTQKGQFPKDIIFTIKTMIAETTPLKIWNWFIRVIMQENISKKELRPVSLLTTLNGPEAEKERKFLERTLKSAVKTLPKENVRALVVANILKQSIPQKNTALCHARQHQKNERYVRSAEKNLSQKQPSIEKCRPVVISVDGFCEKKPVYYLTIKQAHLFYANGVMTANTDQADHIYDESCHICMARPLSLVEEPVIEKPKMDTVSKVAASEYSAIIEHIKMQQEYMENRR